MEETHETWVVSANPGCMDSQTIKFKYMSSRLKDADCISMYYGWVFFFLQWEQISIATQISNDY
jgi:hypothetical protein